MFVSLGWWNRPEEVIPPTFYTQRFCIYSTYGCIFWQKQIAKKLLANKMLLKSTTGINFINVFCTLFFVQKSFLAAFSSYVLALAKKLYKKCARLTLMKLTAAGRSHLWHFDFQPFYQSSLKFTKPTLLTNILHWDTVFKEHSWGQGFCDRTQIKG